MNKYFLILFLSFNAFAQNFGDESDGNCNISGAGNKTEWNCIDVTVTGTPTFLTSTSGIIIRATGDVTIDGTLSASASTDRLSVHANTNNLGGGAGGTCAGLPCTSPGTNAIGSLGGEGAGGNSGNDQGSGTPAGGGGGAGGTYNSTSPGIAGGIGANPFLTAGSGGAQNTTGYGDEANFSTSIKGGVGGGAGGSGMTDFGAEDSSGGDGGAGGGIIQIFAKGKILNNGSILVDGAKGGLSSVDGGSGDSSGGSGGGGSGGAIYIYTSVSFTNIGIVSARGGVSGDVAAAAGNGGAGGAGGMGRIRIDTSSGNFTDTGTIAPSASSFVASRLPSSAQDFTSGISQSCSVVKDSHFDFNLSFILGFLFIFSFQFFIQKLKK